MAALDNEPDFDGPALALGSLLGLKHGVVLDTLVDAAFEIRRVRDLRLDLYRECRLLLAYQNVDSVSRWQLVPCVGVLGAQTWLDAARAFWSFSFSFRW